MRTTVNVFNSKYLYRKQMNKTDHHPSILKRICANKLFLQRFVRCYNKKIKKMKAKFKKDNWLKRNSIEILTIIGGLFIIHVFLFFSAFNGESIDAENANQFGSFIGGYIGSIFALISVVFLYSTLKEQRKTSAIEKFETKYFELIQLHRDNVAEIVIRNSNGKKVFVTLIREFRETLIITKRICRENDIKLEPEEHINLAYMTFFYGVGPNSSRILKKSLVNFPEILIEKLLFELEDEDENLKDKTTKKRNFSYTPFEGHQSRLGHYFRHLYQTVMYVDNSDLKIDKYSYVKILRAQLSNHEQALLFFNSLSFLGQNWRTENLITEYEMIKNLPESFIDENTEIDVKKVYPKLKFEYEEI